MDLTRGDLTSQGDAHDHLTSSFLLPMITNTNDDYLFILFVCLLFICSLLFVVICLLFVYCSLVRWTCKFVIIGRLQEGIEHKAVRGSIDVQGDRNTNE